jgi:flagellar hook assembly protein FlgD
VGTAGTSLSSDEALSEPLTTLAAGTALRVIARVGTTSTYAVQTLDGSVSGYVAGPSLVPRDSRGPNLWEFDDGVGTFSPNSDGSADTLALSGRFSEEVSWRLTFSNDGGPVGERSGTGSEFATSWDGLDGGSPVADGSYAWTLEASDEWGNAPLAETGTLTVDTVAPTVEGVSLAATTPAAVFSPNADGRGDTISFSANTSEPGTVSAAIENSADLQVVTLSGDAGDGSASITWDGRNHNGNLVVDGLFDIALRARDRAGNLGPPTTRTVGVYAAVSALASSASVFWPHDGDARAPRTTLSFQLGRPATATWEIRKLDGTVVYTRYAGAALPAGTYSFRWSGRNRAGALLPPGTYLSYVRGNNATLGLAQSIRVHMNAFNVRASDATPRRRQRITVYATSAEHLRGLPRVRVIQPGVAPFTVTMTRVSGPDYRAGITLRAGRTGTLRLVVSGYDLDGRFQSTVLRLPLG